VSQNACACLVHPLVAAGVIEVPVRVDELLDGIRIDAGEGLLQRAHITAGNIRYIDKETSSMWEQGEDLSVITDHDEAGFRLIEYGRNRKIVLPDSFKREIKEIGLRELRRRGIGQHTLEKALHKHVQLNTFRQIVAAIAECKQEKHRSESPRAFL
jgi:hypothetical protein